MPLLLAPPAGSGAGPKGDTGDAGESAFSTVTIGDVWAWPNSGEVQYLQLDHRGWLSVGAPVFITDGVHWGTLVVKALDSPDPGWVELFHADEPGPAGGTVMLDGAKVSPTGLRGPAGP